MTHVRTLAASVAIVAALGVTAPGSAQEAGDDESVTRSAELVVAPAGNAAVAPREVLAQSARGLADDIATAIPLPRGGTYSGIRWEQAGGTFTSAEIALVLQHNAACQWLRASRDGRETPTSARVLEDVPSWPAWRGSETGTALAQVVADVRAGGGPAALAMLADCDAAHEREVAYAAARNLTPAR